MSSKRASHDPAASQPTHKAHRSTMPNAHCNRNPAPHQEHGHNPKTAILTLVVFGLLDLLLDQLGEMGIWPFFVLNNAKKIYGPLILGTGSFGVLFIARRAMFRLLSRVLVPAIHHLFHHCAAIIPLQKLFAATLFGKLLRSDLFVHVIVFIGFYLAFMFMWLVGPKAKAEAQKAVHSAAHYLETEPDRGVPEIPRTEIPR